DLVEEAFREERAAGTIAEAGGEDFLLGGAAFALEVATGEAAGGGVFLAVVNGEREEVLAGAHGLGDAGGDKQVGLADADVDRAVGEVGVGAGGEGHPEARDGDVVFLVHYRFLRFACRGRKRTARRHAAGHPGFSMDDGRVTEGARGPCAKARGSSLKGFGKSETNCRRFRGPRWTQETPVCRPADDRPGTADATEAM